MRQCSIKHNMCIYFFALLLVESLLSLEKLEAFPAASFLQRKCG